MEEIYLKEIQKRNKHFVIIYILLGIIAVFIFYLLAHDFVTAPSLDRITNFFGTATSSDITLSELQNKIEKANPVIGKDKNGNNVFLTDYLYDIVQRDLQSKKTNK